jgi:aminoglycoside phosphotransferase (APT) family kinase protein
MTTPAIGPAPEAPRRRWPYPPDPRAVLRATGLPPAAVASAELSDLSRSHQVTLAVLTDGRGYVVKRPSDHARAAGRSLAAELYAYRLASWQPGLAEVLPRPLHLDERRQVLTVAAAPVAHLYPTQALNPDFPRPDLAAALGRVLGQLHRCTSGLPLLTVASCGVVHLPDTPEEQRSFGGPSPAALAASRAAAADPVIAAALRRAASALQPGCLVHADVKWDNAVLDPGPPPRVTLFDWELSGLGDPAWDVGSALADTVSIPVRLAGQGALPATPTDWLDPALQALLVAYGAETQRAADGFAERVALCWVARLVHLGLEAAAAVQDAECDVVVDLTTTARRLAERIDDVVLQVRTALEPVP